MSSFNLSWIGENWFQKPQNPLPFFHFKPPKKTHLKRTPKPLNFACISVGNGIEKPPPPPAEDGSDRYERMLDYYFWECDYLPDYRRSAKVEEILSKKKENRTPKKIEEIEEIEETKLESEKRESCTVEEFLLQAEGIADKINEMELASEKKPFLKEEEKLWKSLPHVTGPDGRTMPRMIIGTEEEAEAKFWDFARQFFFGLWGFRQRPYPPGRPCDVAQAVGYKRLEKRYYDFTMKSTGWWYKDRLGRSRGPCELITLKTAWAAGRIDTDTFVWGEDMDEWAPIGMVHGLQIAIATWEVRLGAAATAFLHKLMKGIPPWVPLKGHEKKTYKQLQEEAIESKRRDLAVLEANGGIWPGVRTPSHALFLWASGSDLTPTLEADHMPNKCIPQELRKRLLEIFPDLRPWEVLSVEQALDKITYNGRWYREPLASYTTGPPYIRQWNISVKNLFNVYSYLGGRFYRLMAAAIPGFEIFAENENKRWREMRERAKKRIAELKRKQDVRLGYRRGWIQDGDYDDINDDDDNDEE